MMEEEIINSQKQIISQYMTNLDEKLYQYQIRVDLIANSTLVKEELLKEDEDPLTKGTRISEEVTKYLMLDQSSEVSNYMVYSMNEEQPVYGRNVSMFSVAEQEEWYPLVDEWSRGYHFYAYRGEVLLSMVNEIVDVNYQDWSSRNLGIVKLDLRLSSLLRTDLGDKEGFFVCLVDESGKQIYSSEGFLKAMDNLDSYIMYEQKIANQDLQVRFYFERYELANSWLQVLGHLFPMIFILIIVVVIIAFLYSKKFSERIRILMQKIEHVEQGDFGYQMSIDGNDEIAFLDQAFDRMVTQLNNLIRKNYIQKLENKEAQLRNFQLQINPHFLYNTLEIISATAAINNCFEICDICERLGDIFRYSLGKNYGEYVTVKQELHHTQNYIYIQQIRFPNHFEVVYHLDEKLSDKRIPRFILQPIVENAISHGLKQIKENGKLEISTRQENGFLVICIEDNGEGMSLQKVEELRNHIEDTKFSDDKKDNIGVRNVHQRIKLTCGQQYGIQIASALHQGSVFELWLPLL